MESLEKDTTPSRGGKVRGPVVLCAKGIEQTSGKLLSKVMNEELPGIEPGVLSGPSFADDIARGLPTAQSSSTSPTPGPATARCAAT